MTVSTGIFSDIPPYLPAELFTTLLVQEWRGSGRVGFRGFYARRALRLFPALVLLVAVVGTFAFFADGAAAERTRDGIVPTLLYLVMKPPRASFRRRARSLPALVLRGRNAC